MIRGVTAWAFTRTSVQGEVYRARDTKLDREVAIKVLPEEFVADEERLARFEREAKLLASLNHPNIAGIYGFEEAGGVKALALELVEGPTLAERIARGPIPVDETIAIAKQVAEALEAGHEAGVIHRDLKPANIKLREDGTVKVLDYGLAKALEGETPATSDIELSQSPTLTRQGTQIGVILGTAAYMSPEQAKGKRVDKRTDVWAFGVVLFEMLTGRQLFRGDDVSSTLAKVIERDPDLSSLPAETPASVRRLIGRSLRKDRSRRTPDIASARLELDDALSGSEEASFAATAGTTRQGLWQRPLPAAAALILALAFGGLAAWSLKPALPRSRAHLAISLPDSRALDNREGVSALALSPDGASVVYAGRTGAATQLFVRPMHQFETTPIAGTEGAHSPVFSPDGQWVAFFAAGKLKKVAVAGGPVTSLADAPLGLGASWGPDGSIVYCPDQWGEGLWRVPAAGGDAEALTQPDSEAGESLHALPHHLPGGDVLLFASFKGPSPANAAVEALSIRTGERRVLVQGATQGRYTAPGNLVYGSSGTLLVAPFDRVKLAVLGPALPVLEGVLNSSYSGAAHFDFADDGTLVYMPTDTVHDERSLVAVDREGVVRSLIDARHPYEDMALSPDGRRLALTLEGPSWNIWILELARGTLTRLTLENDNRDPYWTPDGERVVYTSFRNGRYGIFEKSADGSGPEEQLTSSKHLQSPESWTPDGRALAFTQWSPETHTDIWVMPRGADAASESQLIVATNFLEAVATFSPDGRWISYESAESGRLEVYVQPYQGPGGRVQVSTNGGDTAVWARDGRELFYRNGDEMMVVPIETEPSFTAGTPRVLFRGRYLNTGRDYDVSPDGDRFYMIQESAPATEIRVIQNWMP
jgi:serine/threonine-protein kinase